MPEKPGWFDSRDNTLVMPFLLTKAWGGPYDDKSWVSGFQCGVIDGILKTHDEGEIRSQKIYHENKEQIDLIAMAWGYVVEVIDQDELWMTIKFTKLEESDGGPACD